MTPLLAAGAVPAAMAERVLSAGICGSCRLAGRCPVRAEQLFQPVPALLHPAQRQAKIGNGIPDDVIGRLIGKPDQQRFMIGPRLQAATPPPPPPPHTTLP